MAVWRDFQTTLAFKFLATWRGFSSLYLVTNFCIYTRTIGWWSVVPRIHQRRPIIGECQVICFFHVDCTLIETKHILYKTQPSSQKDSPRAADWFPPTMARQEKSLAVCLEILQDYTAKDFSYFAVLTTADFYSNNSQSHFYRTIQTTWNSGTPPFPVSVVRHEEKSFFLSVASWPIKRNTIPWFAVQFCLHIPPHERSHRRKHQWPLSCLVAQPWRKSEARSMGKPYSSFIGISLMAVLFCMR